MPFGLGLSCYTLGTLALVGCQLGQRGDDAQAGQQPPVQGLPALPAPRLDGAMSLEAALRQRRSVRQFTGAPLQAAEIGQLLWAAQGVTDAHGFRTAPSAGALYPLECHVVTHTGVFRYEPRRHRLHQQVAGDQRDALAAAALGQQAIVDAGAVFVISAVYERTARKYGQPRAERYAVLEAGHAAQNLLLQAVALRLGAVPIGAFDDRRVARVLRLGDGEAPLYLIPVGRPPR